jgi:hypothetical protein
MLQISVTGNAHEIQRFMNHFKLQPHYKILPDSERYINLEDEKIQVLAAFQFRPKERKSMLVQITTSSGSKVEFTLLDGKIIEMENGVTYVHGKYYDIFG